MTEQKPHLTHKQIIDYFASAGDPEGADPAVEQHLADCDPCAESARRYYRLGYLIDSWTAKAHGEAFLRCQADTVQGALDEGLSDREQYDNLVAMIGRGIASEVPDRSPTALQRLDQRISAIAEHMGIEQGNLLLQAYSDARTLYVQGNQES